MCRSGARNVCDDLAAPSELGGLFVNTAMKWAVALGAVSFALTLWMLRTDRGLPQSDPALQPSAVRGDAESAQSGHDAPPGRPSDFGAAARAAERIGTIPEGLRYQDEAGPVLANVLRDRL